MNKQVLKIQKKNGVMVYGTCIQDYLCESWCNSDISDFANSEHKHKHKRKKSIQISAAWPSFTLNTTWLQPCLQHFTVQTTCLSFNILASWWLLNENYAIPYENMIKQCLVNDNTHFFSYYVAGLFRKPVLN